VIGEFREFVDFEIERVYKRVDGDRMKLKEQLSKCEQGLEQKAENREVSELIESCHKFDKDLKIAMQKVYLQEEKIARINYTQKLEDLEFQVDLLHKQVTDALNGVGKMQEEQVYRENYAETLSTRSIFPSCLSCGGKPSASSPKVLAASGLIGTDKRFYKGDDLYNNLMIPGKRRLGGADSLLFTEESLEPSDGKSMPTASRKYIPPTVIPAMIARYRTSTESPARYPKHARAATASEVTRGARQRTSSHTRK
jgi:hypothetical protein